MEDFNDEFSIKIYIDNIKFLAIDLIGAVICLLLASVLFIEEDKEMRTIIFSLILFFVFGITILSVILIRSVFFKKPSFVLDRNGIYYNNLLVKNYMRVLWKEIKELKITGNYLFIYLKDPQSYYLRKFKGRIVSEDPLYIHLGDLNISDETINGIFNYFDDNYKNYKDENKEEFDYRIFYRDYY